MSTAQIEIGSMIRIVRGLGEGQTVRVVELECLPMGTGVVVMLAGEYRAVLNPANVEVVESNPVDPIMDAYARYDADTRVHGPEDYDAFRDAVMPLLEGKP